MSIPVALQRGRCGAGGREPLPSPITAEVRRRHQLLRRCQCSGSRNAPTPAKLLTTLLSTLLDQQLAERTTTDLNYLYVQGCEDQWSVYGTARHRQGPARPGLPAVRRLRLCCGANVGSRKGNIIFGMPLSHTYLIINYEFIPIHLLLILEILSNIQWRKPIQQVNNGTDLKTIGRGTGSDS